jgi:predicted acetyltransferase
MELVKPSLEYLPGYKAALERGWGPDNMQVAKSGQDDLERIAKNAEAFIDLLEDLEAKAGPVILPDGSTRPRLPGFNRWMWDGEFCGRIGFRWQPGTPELPPHVLGHIGYSTVPWKQQRGYATRALALLWPEIKAVSGLPYVELSANPANIPSQKVITANGGVFLGEFVKPEAFRREGYLQEGFLYRIDL